jgi:hypothetical protein
MVNCWLIKRKENNMEIVKMTFSSQEHSKLEDERKQAGLSSIQALIRKRLGFSGNDPDPAEIARRGLAAVSKMAAGKPFGLRTLFDQSEWKAWSKGARIQAGKKFFDLITTGQYGVREIGKDAANLQLYIRD